jgi:hypothetical protein
MAATQAPLQDSIDQLRSISRGTTLNATAARHLQSDAATFQSLANQFRQLSPAASVADIQAPCQKALDLNACAVTANEAATGAWGSNGFTAQSAATDAMLVCKDRLDLHGVI